jgi:hypothetical protein
MYCKTGKAKKSETIKETNKDAPAPPLYIPGIKIGGSRASKITCGIKGKSMLRKTETEKPISKDKCCPFQFLFNWKRETDSWTLNGGTGCGHHEHHFFSTNCTHKVVELPDKIKQGIAEYADATANSAMTLRIFAFKSNIELNGDQVQYLQTKYGKSALENSNKGTSNEQLLAYLDSPNDIYYICIFNKVESKLLKFNQKGQPSTKCEFTKLLKKKKQ